MNLGSSPLSNITNTVDARQSTQKMQANNNKRQLSLDGFLVNKKQKTGADENVLLSPDTKDKVNKIREIMPELPTKTVVAALKRSNSNIEAATIDLLDDILTAGKDVDTSFESVNNAVDLSNDHDLSDPVIDEHSSTNKLVQQVKELVPQASIEGIRGALDACQNNIEEAVDLLLDIKPYKPREQKSVQPIDKRAWDNAEVIDLTSPQPPLKVSQKIVVPNSPLLRRNNTIYGSDEAEEDNNIDEEDEQDRDLFADDLEDEVVMYSPPPNTKTFNKKLDINTKRRLIVEEDDDESLSEIDENYIGHIPGLNLAPNKEDEGEYQLKNMLARLLEAQDLAELAETPADLKVSLYDYQKQGLAWLLKREKSRPAGGILADQMGLGKTVQLISLILANKPEIDNTTWISIKRNSGSFEVSGRKKLNNDRKATLIVCPTSCVNQWYKEVTSKTRTGSLTARIHYGNTRVKKAEQLCQYDVVITTYGVIANESPEEPSKWGPTRLVKWFRIILDEAHNVRNQNTKSFKSCYNLDSQMRWCVTGTPIQNKIEDLQSLMKIIRYEYGDINNWKASIGSKDGHKRIQGILSPILLCRTKNTKFLGKPIIELPARNVVIREIELADTEGVEYKQLEEQSKNKFNDYLRAGLVKNFQNVLTLLLRLRQMCDHPYLVKRNLLSSSGSDLSQKNFDSDICSICFDVPEEPTYTPCGHLFCKQCLYGEFEKDIDAYEQTLCPTCKTFVTEDKLLSPTKKKQISKTSHLNQSTKIRALMEELNKAKKTDPKFKAIIFSQWTSMLDLVEASLNQDKWKYGRLDGEMLLNHRTAELERFKKTSDCNLLLMSLKVGGVGLNVTEANYVYLLDPWWNPAIEEQAIDRVHRVGQKKPVHVVRFIIKDSVEKRILALQEKKRAIADGALGASQSSASRLTERDLMELFA